MTAVRFALLGPLRVTADERPLQIRGAVRRSLLAALLLHRNTVVSLERLGELVWGDQCPADVAVALYNPVARLRRSLGPYGARIRTVPPGYLIDVGPGECDLDLFAEHCAAGRRAANAADWPRSAEQYAEALRLWRGEPCAGDAAVLHDQWLNARQHRIEAVLRQGGHAEAVTELRELVAEHPHHEVFAGQLMLALYRGAQSGEALAVYRRLHRAMVEELGVEPGARIRKLRDRIRAGDRSLDLHAPGAGNAPSSPRQLPADARFFAGRDAELQGLTALEDPSGAVVISAVDGMGGIGKTALAVRAAHHVSGRFPDGQLFIDLHGYSADLEPVSPDDALDYLLRSLGVTPQAVPRDLDERRGLYRAQLAGTRTLILLDNAVDADQVRPLLPDTDGCLVLVTSRNRLTGLEKARHLTLDTLSGPEALDLLRDVAGRDRVPGEAEEPAAELVELCGRVPLAVRIVAARLRHNSALTVAGLVAELNDERDRLERLRDTDRNLVSVFDSSLAVLDDPQRRLFHLLGLVPGPDFDAYAAAHLLGTADLARTQRSLDVLLDHNLLIQRRPGRYRLHDLLRAHARTGAPDAAAAARLLDYYLHTARRATTTRAGRDDTPAGADPAPQLAYPEQATTWFHNEIANLVAAAQGSEDHERRAALVEAVSPHLYEEGPWSLSARLNEREATVARSRGDSAAEASALMRLGRITGLMGQSAAARAHHEQAAAIFDELGDLQGKASALQALEQVHYVQGNYGLSREVAEQAVALQRAVGNKPAEAALLSRAATFLHIEGRNAAAQALYRQSAEIHRELRDDFGLANCHLLVSRTHYALGDFDAVEPNLRRALELVKERGVAQGVANVLQELGRQRLLAGDYAAAGTLLDEALTLHLQLGFRLGEGNVYWEQGRIAFARGDIENALELHERAYEIFSEIDNMSNLAMSLCELARVHHARGDARSAAGMLERSREMYRRMPYPIGEAEVGNILAEFTAAAEGPEAGLELYRAAFALAVGVEHPREQAHALAGIARCEARLGRYAAADEHIAQAVDLYRRMRAVEVTEAEASAARIGAARRRLSAPEPGP